jgi:hypothetical protein
MTTLNTTANISPLPSGDYIFRVAGLNNIGQGAFSTINTAMPVPDPYFGNVSLLMHMDGTGNSFVDSSSYNHTITVGGDTTQTSDQSKFGGISAYLDGSEDYLATPSHTSFGFGTNDFTMEGWVRISSETVLAGRLFGNWIGGSWTTNYWSLHTDHPTADHKFTFWVNNITSGSAILTSSTTISYNTWYHIAVSRSGNIFRLFVNGNLESSYTSSTTVDGGGSWPLIIAGDTSANDRYINGYIDELRITKGIARYSSNFTPSAVPFPVSPIITISSQPSNQIASDGNASFGVTASVTLGATLSYQWQKKKGNSSFSNISGATSSTLSLSNLTEADNNGEIYRCIVKSTGGVSLISSVATLIVSSSGSITVECLVVAGGGGGNVGGGGAGGLIYGSSVSVSPGVALTVTVGGGGAVAAAGNNSVFDNFITAYGGGDGKSSDSNGGDGGCGGGAFSSGTAYSGGTADAGVGGEEYAHAGGDSSVQRGGGGGGGTGQAGGTPTNAGDGFALGGTGGNGTASFTSWLSAVSAGVDSGGTRYIGGGGGGGNSATGTTASSGGVGGGGSGATNNGTSVSGFTNTGGGGGGGWTNPGSGGGSGLVSIRYPDSLPAASATTGSPTSVTSGGYRYYTFTGSGSITF